MHGGDMTQETILANGVLMIDAEFRRMAGPLRLAGIGAI